MNNSWSNQTKSTSSNNKIQSFLEALRNSQPKSELPNSESGNVNPFSEFQNKKEVEKRRIEEFHSTRNAEWNRVFSAKEKQKEQRIEQLKAELAQLAKQLKNIDANVTKAITAPVSEAGDYHISYFDQLIEDVHKMLLDATSTNSWLEVYNGRGKKMGHYWSQAKSKGSSYTLNNERSVATSIG